MDSHPTAPRPSEPGRRPVPSAPHDALVLGHAAIVSGRIRARRRARLMPWLAAGAGLALGLVGPRLLVPAPPPPPALMVPAGPVTRGGAAAPALVPVEVVPPERWYRHIRALLEAGELQAAEAHLRRFVQLHPGYRPPP